MKMSIATHQRKFRMLLLSGIAVMPATAVWAQQVVPPAQTANEQSPSAANQEEIVVTAQKRNQRAQDVPMSMTAISGDKLTAEHADTLQDIANHVPGVQLVSAGPATNLIVIRGLNVGSGINSSVATYVDEVPYTSEGPFAWSANLAPNLDSYDLARVEVLRGPQGTLYGANALGGLIKYVSNAPVLGRFESSFLAGVSEVAHSGQTGWEGHAMINVPLGDTAALRVVGNETFFPGYIDDPARGAKDINDVRRYSGRASLLWDPTSKLSIRLTANYQHLSAGDTNTEDLDAVALRPLYGDLTQERVIAEPQTTSNQIYNGTVAWNLGFGSLVSSTSYAKTSPSVTTDLSKLYTPLLGAIFGVNAGAELVAMEPVHSFTQEVRLASSPGSRLEWLVGGFYTDEGAHETETINPINLTTKQVDQSLLPPLGTYSITSGYREYAGFGNLTYHFTPAFEIGVGGRYSSNKQSYHQVNSGLLTGVNDFITLSNQSVFTYSADAKYRFNRHFMAYGRIATGYAPGGPNDVLPGSTLPGSFKSSTTTNYEIGIKGDMLDGRLSYDLDAFDVEWNRIQLEALIGNLYGITNGGKARSQGLEGGLSLRPASGLTLSLGGAYTNAHLTEALPASFGGLPGDRLPLVPRIAGNVGANYEHRLWANVDGFAGIDWTYTGKRLSTFTPGLPRVGLPSYSRVDLRAGLTFERYTVTAFVQNIGNVHGISNVALGGVAGTGNLSANIIVPRTIGLTLAAKF